MNFPSQPRLLALQHLLVLSVVRLTIGLTSVRGAPPLTETLQCLGAEPQAVQIVSIENDRLRVRIANANNSTETIEFPRDEVVAWGRRRSFRTAAQLLLRDGSVLIVDLLQVSPDQWVWGADPLSFASVRPIFRKVVTPRDVIAGAMFAPSGDPATRDELAGQLREVQANDVWWIDKGNQVIGRLLEAKSLDDASGIDQWRLRVRQRVVAIDHSRVRSIRLGAPPAEPVTPDARWMLGFRDGSFVMTKAISEVEGIVHLQLAAGATAQVERKEFYSELCLVRPLHPRVLYLSDLPPKEQRHQPFLTLQRPMRRNLSVLGGLPRWKDFVFTKALGVASRSFVVYDISPGCKRLATETVLDQTAEGGGSVLFRVFVQTDENAAWQMAATSDVMQGDQPPQPLSVPLERVRRVALVVDFADSGDVLDYANWLNLRLEK